MGSEKVQVDSKIEEILRSADDETRTPELIELMKELRAMAADGSSYQEAIAGNDALNTLLHELLFGKQTTDENLQRAAWTLLANTIVSNTTTQRVVWARFGETFLQHYRKAPLTLQTDILLMILYNIFFGGTGLLQEQQLLLAAIHVWRTILDENCNIDFEYLHFILHHFLVAGGRATVRDYAQLDQRERIDFLNYLFVYIHNDSPNGVVDTFLLQHVSKEFKVKSDCVLRLYSGQQQDTNPREAVALLRVIASACGSEAYESIYVADHALFLNVSSLLRCILAAVKSATEPNTFTPMSTLEEVAPASKIPRQFESEASYELKTMLVRCIANLLYKNKTNQGYCLDTQLMHTLLECTIPDARNPLMKEWSILAIRNACEECPGNQAVIANLTNQGPAPNDIISELNLQMGAIRIQPNS